MKIISTSTSNYKLLRDKDAYYVDKTMEIEKFFNLGSDVILMPRPRRFGKTLFLSTLYYLFSQKEQDKNLFRDTYIYDTKFFKQHFGKYPVIFLTLKDVRNNNFNDMLNKIGKALDTIVFDAMKSIDLNTLDIDEDSKNILNNILIREATQTDYEESIKALSIALKEYYQISPILLIDEYDTPIITSYLKGYYEEAIDFFRMFLGSALKDNGLNIKKALITGIFRVSGESLFGGLNNIEYATILSKRLSLTCGFTRDETIKLLNDYNITGAMQKKALLWYNSYTIGDNIITNPWSILNFADKKEFKSYWANTSSNELIIDLIKQSHDFKDYLEQLLKNEPVDIQVNEALTFTNKELAYKDNLFSFLFFAGYLKCSHSYMAINGNKEFLHCKLIPTNVECEMIFEQVISSYVREQITNIPRVLRVLTDGNLKLFVKELSYALRDNTSYHDTLTENSYHMFLLGLMTNLINYEIISNSEAGYGRVDIVLLHKENKTKPAIVMELKVIDEFEEETKDEALKSAVKQIKEKEYISLAKKRGYNNILAFGMVFDGKRCWAMEIEN